MAWTKISLWLEKGQGTTPASIQARLLVVGGLWLILLAGVLYWPFLGNALVFDDHGMFPSSILEFALVPFNLERRTFPYFTLGFVQVEGGSIEVQRMVSLFLHILCAWMIFRLSSSLLLQVSKTATSSETDEKQQTLRANVLGLIGASWFVIHPVAVYGAAYLVQRTILFSTLFSLLALWFYRRGCAEDRMTDAITAALFYSLAIFSKEHAVMLPLAAVALSALYAGTLRRKVIRAGLFLLLCVPAAIVVVFANKQVVGTTYEVYVGPMIGQLLPSIPFLGKPGGPWLVSVLMQAGFFFDYLRYWLVPDLRFLSVDMRIDFASLWSTWWFFPKAGLFFASPIAALFLLRRGGAAALFACGLLYSWLLFISELASVRFQDPFVLYRSYLWAPGYILMLAALCRAVSLRRLLAIALPVLAILFYLGHDRLVSFRSQDTIWADAEAKLESPSLIGVDRIFYNRGLALSSGKQYKLAIDYFNRVIAIHPDMYQVYYQRGAAYLSLKEFSLARADFNRVLEIHKDDGPAFYARGLILEQAGCIDEAVQDYEESLKNGVRIAELKLAAMAKNPSINAVKKKMIVPGSCQR